MKFVYNPFTRHLDVAEQDSSPFGDVQTLTGNSGGSVPPDGSGNISILGSGGVTVSGNAGTNTLTISFSGSGISWSTISSSQTLVVNNGYICVSPGGSLSLALPATSSVGSIIEITLDGSTGFTVTQGAGQQIKLGNLSTTAGVSGSISSTQQGDSIVMVCSVANLKWNVISSMGNPTII